MPAVLEIVTLVVDGQVLRGWQEVNVTRSMQHAAISFAMKATNPAWSAEAMTLRRGKQVEIRTSPATGPFQAGGGDLLCTGDIDEYEADIGEGEHKEIRISGRSKAGRGVDCPPAKHKTGRIENKDLLGVAQELDEFDIGFLCDQQLTKIAKVQIVPGEPMFAAIEREARYLGLMLASQPDGSVLITRANSKRHQGALVEGQPPVRRWSIKISAKNRRSPVIVRGQRAKGVGKDNLRQEASDYDPEDGRYRPIILFHEGDGTQKDLQRRAKWQRLRMSGYGTTVGSTVSTWRDEGGTLWDPGRLLAVQVDSEDLDKDLTLSSSTFTQNLEHGTTASLTLVDPRTHGGKAPSGGSSDEVFDPGEEFDDE